MKWSLDTHKYFSETTITALKVITKYGLTRNSTNEEIDIAEKELAKVGVYKTYDNAKGRVRRALFTYFRAYHCIDDSEQLTNLGRAIIQDKLSLEEFCLSFLCQYTCFNEDATIYPFKWILKFFEVMTRTNTDVSILSASDFHELIEIKDYNDINDDFAKHCVEKREDTSFQVNEREIGYDVWGKLLELSGVFKRDQKVIKINNLELYNWLIKHLDQDYSIVKGEVISGALGSIPKLQGTNNTDIFENYKLEDKAIRAFLFEGVDFKIINKYIYVSDNSNFFDLMKDLDLSENELGFYKTFLGYENIVANRLYSISEGINRFIGTLLLEEPYIAIRKENKNSTKIGENVLLYGVPGSGKSYTIKDKYCDNPRFIERVVFHPDYTYNDFIGQILPCKKDNQLTYDFIPGPFTRILKKAIDNDSYNYYLVIEEINRGNAPAIFGDVFQLLDRNDEGESIYGISNTEISNVLFGNKNRQIKIPDNLFIIATMNTSDQNVFTLDTAFQRRWRMRLIENNIALSEHAGEKILDTNVTWLQFATRINKLILDNNIGISSSEDKRLGSYFVRKDELIYDFNEDLTDVSIEVMEIAKTKNRIFGEKVLKFLWDDAFKFSRESIFKESYKSLEELLFEFHSKKKDDRLSVFRDDLFK